VRPVSPRLRHNRPQTFYQEKHMATPKQTDQSRQDNQQRAPAGQEQRSENLLPAGDQDSGSDDGRYDVAEEVNLDQQSDMARRVGKPPKGIAADALAESLKDEDAGKQ
jgi:hypothetical protein